MPAPFAALEARLNSAVFKRLPNADATLAGLPVSGIFDNAYQLDELSGGVAGSAPEFDLLSSSVPANVQGLLLVVNGTTYKVVEPMPDGTGMTTLRLRV
ncbi:MAG: head-tail joining protein [Burkholderiaceae bacterium]